MLESYTPPTTLEKEELFDDTVQEIISDLKLLNKKIGVVDTKCEELGDITDHFHDSTDKLETLYSRDIAKRKSHYNGLFMTDDSLIINLNEIDSIFDSIEQEEHRSMMNIMLYWHNLMLLAVMGASAYVWTKMSVLGNKSR
jgi:hypothetical protein